MSVVALLTGRGGSTLQNKNILPVLNKPLLYYPSSAAIESGVFDHYFISSDDQKILDAAPKDFEHIMRPKDISQGDSQHIDCIRHSLKYIFEKYNISPKILVVLMANSATILPEYLSKAVEMLEDDKNASAVVGAYIDQDHHPHRAKKLCSDNYLRSFCNLENQHISTNRQDLSSCYFLSHNFWAMNLENIEDFDKGDKPWTFLGDKVKPMNVENAFDVHTLEDIKISENWLLKYRYKNV